jgi:tripeptide aminopeptidase
MARPRPAGSPIDGREARAAMLRWAVSTSASAPSASRPFRPPSESVVDRFLRYVRINTESREGTDEVPSSPGQWDLARLLSRELQALGARDVHLSDTCIVYARVPGNLGDESTVPCLGLLAHMDTSPAVSGAHVHPIVHERYAGGDVVLPGDPREVLTVAQHPVLAEMIGDDLITSDGTTLLGPIAIGFTSDEEIGIGIDRFDVGRFGAKFAYTVDGDALGVINHETWSALGATITFTGVSTHPGTAKGVMVNSAYAAADFLLKLPADMRPETTEHREGFIHPVGGTLGTETSVVRLILRDFDAGDLADKERLVRRVAAEVAASTPGLRVGVDVREQYRNMNEVLKDEPCLVSHALEATRRAGLVPATRPIRGGTDGSKLTFRGLPCPNIFTGGHNFHSKLEFNSRRGLEKTTETLVHLAQIVVEES